MKFIFLFFSSSPSEEVKKTIEERVFGLGFYPNISLEIVAANIFRDLDVSLEEHLIDIIKRENNT
jgi:hypothetical protein